VRSLAPILTFLLLTALPAAADARVHVVAAGETLSALAERYEVSVAQLQAWNTLEGDGIRVGQSLTVEDVPTLQYRTVPGDTLGCIAQRHRLPLATIRADNPHLGRRLEVGVVLRLRGATDPRAGDAASEAREPVRYVVRSGDSLTRIARRHEVTVAQLVEWNEGLEPDHIRIGSRLLVGHTGRSESVGVPWCGHISGARQAGEHPAYVLRNPDRSWGTGRTLQRIERAFDVVRRRHRDAPRVRVHDLSLPGGGAIDDHRSHQSGRDVDITYYRRRGCAGPGGCPLERVDPDELDVRRQWTLFHAWLSRSDAEAIYVDYALQRSLYREARRRGATRAQLRRWFQHPRGRRNRDGIIRHFPNHRDHFHVRFACSRGERRCR